MTATIADTAPWLATPSLQTLIAALSADGEEARIVGGAVRNALLGAPVGDVDLSTTTLPDETIRRVEAAGFKAVPTGVAHGTVTVVADDAAFEVTTLRADVATDGRHATVAFGRDWQADAERRDFTMNALYATADGTVIDLVGGLADLDRRLIRFIGDADTRIREDYLRVLRFFRFFAQYGHGRPDADGLRAATRLKDGLDGLSAERVWMEMRKLLGAADPSRALLWMRQTGVLTRILPESENWGIDAIHDLVAAEQALDWPADALLRLIAIVPPQPDRMTALAERLRLSGAERDRLVGHAMAQPPREDESDAGLRKRLYFGDRRAVADRLRLAVAINRTKAQADADRLTAVGHLIRQLALAEAFEPPVFPVTGDDLKAVGVAPGPELGRRLDALKRVWADDGFKMGRAALMARLETADASSR